MKRLDNGDYLVPAIRASEAVEVVRGHVDVPTICAINLGIPTALDSSLWLVHPHYRGPESHPDDSKPVDAEWIQSVVPDGWHVSIDTRQGLLLIRSRTRQLYFLQTFTTGHVSRYLVRSAFTKLGIVLD